MSKPDIWERMGLSACDGKYEDWSLLTLLEELESARKVINAAHSCMKFDPYPEDVYRQRLYRAVSIYCMEHSWISRLVVQRKGPYDVEAESQI